MSVLAFVESGHAFDSLRQIVQQCCQETNSMPPVLPLEYEGVRYRLHQAAAEGKVHNLSSAPHTA